MSSFPPRPIAQCWQRLARIALTLKFRLALGSVAALAAGIGLVTWMLLERAESDTLAQQRERELAAAAKDAGEIGERIMMLQRMLQAVADRAPPHAAGSVDADEALLAAQPVLLRTFDSVFVAGSDGLVRTRWQSSRFVRQAVDIGGRAYFRNLQAQRQAQVSDALSALPANQPIVVIAVPLAMADGSTGLLAGVVDLTGRLVTAGIADRSENGLVVVTDAQGRIAAHPDPAMLGQPLAAEKRLLRAVSAMQTMGSPPPLAELEIPAPDAVIAAASVPGVDWMVWRQHDNEALLAPLAAGRRSALGWALASIAALSLGAVLALHLALRPLDRLQQRARRLFDDDLPADDGWPGARGEIGRLERVLRRVSKERSQLEDANRSVFRRLETAMEAAPVGIAFTRARRFELASREFCRLLGHKAEALALLPLHAVLVTDRPWATFVAATDAAFKAGLAYDDEHEVEHPDGKRLWVHLRGQPVNPADADAGAIWTLNDVTQNVASRRALEWAALHDPLTGLANRKAFAQRVERLFASLPQAQPAALIVLDLDRFKPVNDRHGHAAGDVLLRAVAATVVDSVRPGDLVARLGGDEFAVVLERCASDGAERVAVQIRSAVASLRVDWHGQVLSVGTSAGVAMLGPGTADPAAWFEAADRACYRTKPRRSRPMALPGPVTLT